MVEGAGFEPSPSAFYESRARADLHKIMVAGAGFEPTTFGL